MFQNPENSTARYGPEQCPQLIAQDREMLVPVGVERSISVSVENLPDASKVCILRVLNS